jgi:hypothetical protein
MRLELGGGHSVGPHSRVRFQIVSTVVKIRRLHEIVHGTRNARLINVVQDGGGWLWLCQSSVSASAGHGTPATDVSPLSRRRENLPTVDFMTTSPDVSLRLAVSHIVFQNSHLPCRQPDRTHLFTANRTKGWRCRCNRSRGGAIRLSVVSDNTQNIARADGRPTFLNEKAHRVPGD